MDELSVCRLCLGTEYLIELYAPNDGFENASMLVKEYCAVNVYPKDGFPKKICDGCVNTLLDIQTFQERCLHSQTVLESYTGPELPEQMLLYLLKERRCRKDFDKTNHRQTSSEVATNVDAYYKSEECCDEFGIEKCDNNSFDISFGKTEDSNESGLICDKAKPSDQIILETKEMKNFSNCDNSKVRAVTKDIFKSKLESLDKFLEEQLNILQNPAESIQLLNMKKRNPNYYSLDNRIKKLLDPKADESSLNSEISPTENNLLEGQSKDEERVKLDILVKSQFDTQFKLNMAQYRKCKPKFNTTPKITSTMNQIRVRKVNLCYICGKMVTYFSDHLDRHTGIRDFKCDTCGKTFASRNAVRKHSIVHNPKRTHICERCGAGFSRRACLSRHIQNVHVQLRPYECTICFKRFKMYDTLKQHKIRHTDDKPYMCVDCPKYFAAKKQLDKHRVYAHDAPSEGLFRCPACNKLFSYEHQLEAHLKQDIHYLYECKICSHDFFRKKNYDRHMERKHDVRIKLIAESITCRICGKQFKERRYLTQHMKLHTDGGKRFKCEICGRCFLYNFYLKEHARMHTGDRPAKCNLCDKTYVSNRQLKKHVKSHAQIRPKRSSTTREICRSAIT